MKVLRIVDNGRAVNHYGGAKQGGVTLCGLECDGDSELNITPGVYIEGKITCPDCIAIIRHCHNVNPSELKQGGQSNETH